MRKIAHSTVLLIAFAVCFISAASAQTLSVKDIMDPSLVGTRVDGERLSPDGTKVVYMASSTPQGPRELYLIPSSGGTATKILSARDFAGQGGPGGPQNRPAGPPQGFGQGQGEQGQGQAYTPNPALNYGINAGGGRGQGGQGGGRGGFGGGGFGGFGGGFSVSDWSSDSKRLLISSGGDIYVLTLGETKPRRFTHTQAPEVGARFLDNDRIIYQQSGNVFVLNTADSSIIQLSREANQQSNISVQNVQASKDGKMVSYVVSESAKDWSVTVPNYLSDFVQAGNQRRGWSTQKLFAIPTDGSRDIATEIKLPAPEGVSNFRRIAWAADGRSLIVDRLDKDTKRRQLFYVHNVGSKDEQIILVSDETDPAWQAELSSIIEPNPKDASQLYFCSEKDGYNHIYLATLKKNTAQPNPTGEQRQENQSDPGYSSDVDIKQLTKGNWQVEWAKWAADGIHIIYLSTEGSAAERDFWEYDITSGERLKVSSADKGMRASPQMSENDGRPTLIFDRSTWNKPEDLYALSVCPRCESVATEVRLTNTVPEALTKIVWTATPQSLNIPSRDGKQIPARIYLPTGFDKSKKYPMVIFIHGAGYLQNEVNGWTHYYREFMFNEILVQKGYVVLDIDYRGSAGYGRDWRTGVYDFLGGKDMDDHVDAIDYMVKNYAVDPAKVGAYGGSYGGFMAEMLAFRASDKIAAAAALRPVADWKNYYTSSPSYTAQRLGFPDKNPEAYKRSSPIAYADGLKTHLLILHGISDTNVPVQDSMQLTEKLIRLGKTQYFEEMFYPSENHDFMRPESWTDEYSRILALFEKYLK